MQSHLSAGDPRVIRAVSVRPARAMEGMRPVNHASMQPANAPKKPTPAVAVRLDGVDGRFEPNGDPEYYIEPTFIVTPMTPDATHIIQDITIELYQINADGTPVLQSITTFREFAALDPPGSATVDSHEAWSAEFVPGVCGYKWLKRVISWSGTVTEEGVDQDGDGRDDPATGSGNSETSTTTVTGVGAAGGRAGASGTGAGSLPTFDATEAGTTATEPGTGAYRYEPDTPPGNAVTWFVTEVIDWCSGWMGVGWEIPPDMGGGTPTPPPDGNPPPPDTGGSTPTPPPGEEAVPDPVKEVEIDREIHIPRHPRRPR